jgi:hypothetical protein
MRTKTVCDGWGRDGDGRDRDAVRIGTFPVRLAGLNSKFGSRVWLNCVKTEDLGIKNATPKIDRERDKILIVNVRVLYCTVRYGTERYGTVLNGTLRYGTLRYGTVRYASLRYATVHYASLRYGTLRHATLRYTTLRYGTLRYGTLRYGVVDKFGTPTVIK